MKKIMIVDYGMGNLESVGNALSFLGYSPFISSDPDNIAAADGYILPGVGAFAIAMKNLEERGLIDALQEGVIARGKPILGICLGMQLIAESSSEMGLHAGLGWMKAKVVQIDGGAKLKVPHVGWNDIQILKHDLLFKNLPGHAHFYFDHSYHFICDDNDVAARCDYGIPLVAAIQRGNIFATQFHPEKSQTAGLKLLRNFLNYAEESRC
jgi:glutamine amidotransferase